MKTIITMLPVSMTFPRTIDGRFGVVNQIYIQADIKELVTSLFAGVHDEEMSETTLRINLN